MFSNGLVLFLEDFNDKRFKLRWLKSISNIDKQGNLVIGYGPITVNQYDGQGLKTEDDYRYYLLSRKMKRKYSNRNKTLVIQYQVVFPSLMECGGAYIKVLGSDFEPSTFNSKTPYKIMFGPDVCGFAFEDRELKAILNYNGRYYKINQIIRYTISHIPQLFTFIIKPDNTYEIQINMTVVAKGFIGKDFRMVRPKFIQDKKVSPPPDWEREEFVVEGDYKSPPHTHHPPTIVDPEYYLNSSKFNISKGLPFIKNPDYMKPWHPGFVRNSKYKGKWAPPLIFNPDYNIDDEFYLQSDLGGVAIDVWQMSSGVIYDNILITDNEKFAKRFAKERWKDVVEMALHAERHTRPYNQTMKYDGSSVGNQNEDHSEFIDDTGQNACYNNAEVVKNMVFGPTEEELENIIKQRTNKMTEMKEEVFSQLSPLPRYSFFDPRYFKEEKGDSEDFDLTKRLKLIDGRKLTKTVKFVTENSLTNF